MPYFRPSKLDFPSPHFRISTYNRKHILEEVKTLYFVGFVKEDNDGLKKAVQ